MKTLLKQVGNGQVSVFYILDTETGIVGMTVLPTKLGDLFTTEGNWQTENLVQLKLVGDEYPGSYSQGMTMRNSQSCSKLRYVGQEITQSGGWTRITTRLQGPRVSCMHTVGLPDDRAYITVETVAENTSDEIQKLEMLSSFSICDLAAAGAEERMADLNLYRMQSRWSGEGKIEKQNLTALHMEPSWSRHGVNSVRWGQVGSMPVRGYFPWAVLEDARYGWNIGAQLYYNGSWQMELYEKDDKAALSGGLADREFGHWMKTLQPGEKLETPLAVVAVSTGDLDDISHALTMAQQDRLDVPASEEDLPVLFNEYCTTWGNPTAENLEKITDSIRGHGFRYLVIDAGWYSIGDGAWYDDQGDWDASEKRFPEGLKAVTDRIRAAGMIPGIWFEHECINKNSQAYQMTEMQLKRDGIPISDGGKRFWDMRRQDVTGYLDRKVIDLLKDNGFGYIKVDYNGNMGIGPDDPESPGEGLRGSVLASREFFRRMRRKIPDLVIENCASGGHRLEPSMMEVSSMASFSDAHECVIIPIIAADLHRAILPRQSQIWAVLRAEDSDRRLIWSMVNGLLGRLCVSGDVHDLSGHQWEIVDRGIAFYRKCAPVIKEGFSRRQGIPVMDQNHPAGWQALVREGEGEAAGLTMAVVHQFEKTSEQIRIRLDREMEITGSYSEDGVRIRTEGRELVLEGMEALSAAGILLRG